MRRIFIVAFIFGLMFVPAAQAQPTTMNEFLTVAYITFPGPCSGQVAVLLDDLNAEKEDPAEKDLAGLATGMQVSDIGVWTLAKCEITLDSVYWNKMSTEERCRLVVHEVGHLAMHRHQEGGVMEPEPGYLKACAPDPTLRGLVYAEVNRLAPPEADVRCGKWIKARVICRVESWPISKNGYTTQKTARYQVRITAYGTIIVKRLRKASNAR